MRVYSFRLIAAVALAFSTPATAQFTPDPNPGSTDSANPTLTSTGANTDGHVAEFFDDAVTNLYATPLPTALLLLGFGLALARRAAASDRRRLR
jgi:hypothetical protein